MIVVDFTLRDGTVLSGAIKRSYYAFEGDLRYIIVTKDGREYRCSRIDGKFIEYVA